MQGSALSASSSPPMWARCTSWCQCSACSQIACRRWQRSQCDTVLTLLACAIVAVAQHDQNMVLVVIMLLVIGWSAILVGSSAQLVAASPTNQFSRQLPRPFRLGHEHLWRCRRTAGWAHRQCDGPRVPRGSSRNRYCYPGHAHAAARFPFEQESGRVGRRVVSRGVSGVTPRP